MPFYTSFLATGKYQKFKRPAYDSFLYIAQHIAVIFFLCNEVRKIKPSCNPEKCTLERINSHRFNKVLSTFLRTTKSNKNLLYIIYCKTCILYLFVLTLQTGFAARWCSWFSANNSSIEHVCPPRVYTTCKETWVKKKHCCQWSGFFATNAPSKGAQMCSATSPFAQNFISRDFQHSKAFEKHENKKLFELNGALFVFS